MTRDLSYAARLGTALRYAAEEGDREAEEKPSETFLGLAANLSAEDRWGGEKADQTKRGILADYLREEGREEEADWLQNPEQHVMILRGRVHPATADFGIMRDAISDLRRHVRNWSGGDFEPGSTFSVSVDGGGLEGEGIEEPPLHHARAWSTDSEGWAEEEGDFNNFVHYAALPSYMADQFEAEVNSADYGWNTEPGTMPDAEEDPGVIYNDDHFDVLLDRLRRAPVERTLTPKERQKLRPS